LPEEMPINNNSHLFVLCLGYNQALRDIHEAIAKAKDNTL
jgi:hypothetical protein